MRRRLPVLLLALSAATLSCQHKLDKQTIAQYTQRLSKSDTMPKQLIIKDRSKYSEHFIDGLRKSNYPGKITLDNNLIVVGKDTTHFPETMQSNVTYHFTGQKKSITYIIDIKRINLTDLTFTCSIANVSVTLFQQVGQATLSPFFFLAAEAPEDDITGELFGAYPYIQDTPGSNKLIIKISTGQDENHHLRAVVNGEKLWNGSPVLRTK